MTSDGPVRRRSGEIAFDRLAGHPVLSRLATLALRAPLRVLGYHDVMDVEGFRTQMEHIVERYSPVTSSEVIGWLEGRPLPSDAVWVTFDDGDPSIVEHGLPVLEDLGIAATMFICPGVVGTDRAFWWQVADAVAPHEVGPLKLVPDETRTRRIEELRDRHIEETGSEFVRPQLTHEHIARWVDAGCDIGNHTWDHPLLDQCDPVEQERQITLAHEWLVDNVGGEQRLFAYPNGNRTDHARAVVERLGYSMALLFDHSLATVPRFELSRLRTNADSELLRFRSIVAGVHPLFHRLRGGC